MDKVKKINYLFRLSVFSLVLVVSSVVSIFTSTGLVSAETPGYCSDPAKKASKEKDFLLQGISYYDPCSNSVCSAAGGTLTGPAPTSISGADNEEKAWNYFTGRGLTPIGAAGAMGNIEAESGFRASAVESTGAGFGIIQWTGERRTKLESAAAAAGINLSENDAALLFQLNYLWDGEYGAMTWQEQVNAETTVEGDTTKASFWPPFSNNRSETQTGNGSTMVFHALIERSGDVPTEADKIPGHGVLTHRIDNAKGFLEKYSKGGGENSGSCGISKGGLTWDQAVSVAKKIADNWDSIYCSENPITTGGNPGGYCGANWVEGYCTAGSALIAALTVPDPSALPGIPNGVRVADQLISHNPDLYTNVNPDGSNLQPFSIWSFGTNGENGEPNPNGNPGHTGTIVGIGGDGSIITLETNWAGETPGATNSFLYNPGRRVAVFQYPTFEAFKKSHNGYTFNTAATPKDNTVATNMAKNMAKFIGN